MSQDDKKDRGPAPGSRAGDSAPTQQVPHIPKPAAKKPSAKKSPAKNATTVSQTDKGRPREDDKRLTGSVGTPTGGPRGHQLTAADYARTTKQSPSTTAVIPAIKDPVDDAPDRGPKKSPAATTFSQATDPGSGRRASLRLTRVEPWSVTRLAFAISVAMMIVGVVAVTIFWVVLEATGVWDQINDSVTSVLSDDSSSFNITDYLGFGRLVGLTLVLSAINVILMTALATIAAHLYNLAAQLIGGVEVTFAEER